MQDVADFVGDSLGLSREAAKTRAPTSSCSAACISWPRRRPFSRRTRRCCCRISPPVAPSPRPSTPISCAQWKAEHPGAVVVSYVNTTAEVKAESDYCCTSGNAVEIVNSIPADQEILFLPDMFLGAHVRRVTGRENMHVWMGECHVHAGIDPEHIALQRAAHPGAELLIHPECGCATSVVEAVSAGDIDPTGVQILSTEGMISRPRRSDADDIHRRHRNRDSPPLAEGESDEDVHRGQRTGAVRLHEGDDASEGASIARAPGASASPSEATSQLGRGGRSSVWWRSAGRRRYRQRPHPRKTRENDWPGKRSRNDDANP